MLLTLAQKGLYAVPQIDIHIHIEFEKRERESELLEDDFSKWFLITVVTRLWDSATKGINFKIKLKDVLADFRMLKKR